MRQILQDVHLSSGGAETVLVASARDSREFVTVGIGLPDSATADIGPHHHLLVDARKLGTDLLDVLRDQAILVRAQERVPKELDVVMHHHFGLALGGNSRIGRVYLHTPTRVLWEAHRVPWEVGAITEEVREWMMHEEIKSISSAARVYVNSRATQARVSAAYGVDAQVLYPPIIQMEASGRAVEAIPPRRPLPREFALTVGRITPGKQIVEAAQYAHLLPIPWVIAGGGRLAKQFAANLPSNVLFLGPVSDAEKAYLIGSATVCIGTSREDFGLFVAESIAHGRPTIAEEGSGALELGDERNCTSYRNVLEDEGRSFLAAVAAVSHQRGKSSHRDSVRALLDPRLFAHVLMD